MIRRELDRTTLSGPALRTFFAIARRWSLTGEEQMRILGISEPATLGVWQSGGDVRLEAETLARISAVLGIYAAINVIIPLPDRADEWMRWPNTAPLFGGRSALQRMMDGGLDDLIAVRRYVDAWAYN